MRGSDERHKDRFAAADEIIETGSMLPLPRDRNSCALLWRVHEGCELGAVLERAPAQIVANVAPGIAREMNKNTPRPRRRNELAGMRAERQRRRTADDD